MIFQAIKKQYAGQRHYVDNTPSSREDEPLWGRAHTGPIKVPDKTQIGRQISNNNSPLEGTY